MQQDKQRMENEVKSKEEELNRERQERERLMKMIQDMQSNTMIGGNADDDQKMHFSQVRQKMKKHEKEKQSERDKSKKEEDNLMSE